jgi:sigma-E factor negative regulatory protein RseB
MVRGWIRGWACLLLLGGLMPLAAAQAGAASEVSPADARAWLARIHGAASTANYHGTLVFSAGGVMSSSRIWHYCVGEDTYERRESLDGRQRRVLRHNESVYTVWPQNRLAVVERGGILVGRKSGLVSVDPRALEHYALRPEGASRVAGREADTFVLQPRDALRFSQRLWADRETGLMLRADVIGPDGAVLESAQFSSIEVDVKPQPDAVLGEIRRLHGERELKLRQSDKQRADLAAEGWALAEMVEGFELAGCVKRALGESDNGAPHMLQAVFFDGLTHVSLFIEPLDEGRHGQSRHGRMGATSTLMRSLDGHWITAIGDVPLATLERFVNALQRRQ